MKERVTIKLDTVALGKLEFLAYLYSQTFGEVVEEALELLEVARKADPKFATSVKSHLEFVYEEFPSILTARVRNKHDVSHETEG
jgi:hypothetical protein